MKTLSQQLKLALLTGLVGGVAVLMAQPQPVVFAQTATPGTWEFSKIEQWTRPITIPAAPGAGSMVISNIRKLDIAGADIDLKINRTTAICATGGSELIRVQWSFPDSIQTLRPGQLLAIPIHVTPSESAECNLAAAFRSELAVRWSDEGGVGYVPPDVWKTFWGVFSHRPNPVPAGARNSYTPSFPEGRAGTGYIQINVNTPDAQSPQRGVFGFTYGAGNATGRSEEMVTFGYTYNYVRAGAPKPPTPSPTPTPNRSMSLEAKHYRVDRGETIQIPIYLNYGDDIANLNFTVGYDPNVARPEGNAAKGNMLSGSLFSSNAAETGLFRGAFAGTTGVSGTGTVAYIPFKANGPAGSKTPLTLAVSTINQPAGRIPTIAVIHGSITIAGMLQGDCDGDGKLSAIDALCALEMSVKLIPVKMVLDIDRTGDVTSRDSTLILQGIIREK